MPNEDSIVVFKSSTEFARPVSKEYASGYQSVRSNCQIKPKRQVESANNIASIPSRYQTYRYNVNESKAFNATSRRFDSTQNELPGPGYYKWETIDINKSTNNAVSGSNSFTSRMKRFNRSASSSYGAAPGSYNLLSSSLLDYSKKSVPTAAFARQIILGVYRPDVPGPASYSATLDDTTKKGASCAFKSSVERHAPLDTRLKDLPPPGSYDLDKALNCQNTGTAISGAKSSFLASPRKQPEDRNSRGLPGPGAYNIANKNSISAENISLKLRGNCSEKKRLTIDDLLSRLPRDWLEPAKPLYDESLELVWKPVSAVKETPKESKSVLNVNGLSFNPNNCNVPLNL